MTDNPTNTSLLLNVLEQMGNMRQDMGTVLARLEEGSKRHKHFDEVFDILDHRTDIIEDKVIDAEPYIKRLLVLERKVNRHETFQNRLGAILGIASAIITTVWWLLWGGLSWVFTNWADVRAFFGRWFH